MVNSQIKDEGTGEMVNISSILNGDTLETNLKGFMLEIKSLSYSTISIEIRGFEQKEENTGSYYELKLISAIVIKLTTAEGTTTQFIQSEIPNTDCDTLNLHGFDFNLITADAVYKALS
ncbi:MAG: hypothetical protein J6A54_04625 [Clostridia bacterium]|nr:hypothetical protein [Clostridia bacterium]